MRWPAPWPASSGSAAPPNCRPSAPGPSTRPSRLWPSPGASWPPPARTWSASPPSPTWTSRARSGPPSSSSWNRAEHVFPEGPHRRPPNPLLLARNPPEVAPMDFRFSSEHEAFRQMVREFAAREIAPYIREWDERGHFEFSVLEKMGELGILGVCIPERWGGGGMDYISLAIAAEEIEYVESSYREYISVHTGLTSLALLQWGTEEQQERYLKPLARGEQFAAFGLTAPNARSDVAALQTVARRHGDVYVLNGEKAWITLGDRADVVLIFAKTDPEARHEGISAFIVEKTFPGFKGTPIKNKLGVRAGSTARITLQDVEVP